MLPRPRTNVAVALATATVLLCVVGMLPGAEAQLTITISPTPYAGDTAVSGAITGQSGTPHVYIFVNANQVGSILSSPNGQWSVTLTTALQVGDELQAYSNTVWSSTHIVTAPPPPQTIAFAPRPTVGDSSVSFTMNNADTSNYAHLYSVPSSGTLTPLGCNAAASSFSISGLSPPVSSGQLFVVVLALDCPSTPTIQLIDLGSYTANYPFAFTTPLTPPSITLSRLPYIGMSTVQFTVSNAVSGQTVRVYDITTEEHRSCQSAMNVPQSTTLSAVIAGSLRIVVTAIPCSESPTLADAESATVTILSSTGTANRPAVAFAAFNSANSVQFSMGASNFISGSSLAVQNGGGSYGCINLQENVGSAIVGFSPAIAPGAIMHAFLNFGACPDPISTPSLTDLQNSDPIVTLQFTYPLPPPTITITTSPAPPTAGDSTLSGTVTNAPDGSEVTLSINNVAVTSTTTTPSNAWTIYLPKRLGGGETISVTITANGLTSAPATTTVGLYTTGYRAPTADRTNEIVMSSVSLPAGEVSGNFLFRTAIMAQLPTNSYATLLYSRTGDSAVGRLMRFVPASSSLETFFYTTTPIGFGNGGGISVGVNKLLTFDALQACFVDMTASPGAPNCGLASDLGGLQGGAKIRVLDGGGELTNNVIVDIVTCHIRIVTSVTEPSLFGWSFTSTSLGFVNGKTCADSPVGLPSAGPEVPYVPSSMFMGKLDRATMRVGSGGVTEMFSHSASAPDFIHRLRFVNGVTTVMVSALWTVSDPTPLTQGLGINTISLTKAFFVSNQHALPTLLLDEQRSHTGGAVVGFSSPSSMFTTRSDIPVSFDINGGTTLIETVHSASQGSNLHPRMMNTERVIFVQDRKIFVADFSAITDALKYNPCHTSVTPPVCATDAQNTLSVTGTSGNSITASACTFDAINDPSNPAPCSCPSSYGALITGIGSSASPCEDVNECAAATSPCQYTTATISEAGGSQNLPALTCNNLPAALPTCSSSANFVVVASGADAGKFEDVNECASGNGGCGGVCTNNFGAARTCACGTGYVGDGITCADYDECKVGGLSNGAPLSATTNPQLPAGTTCTPNVAPATEATFTCLPGYVRASGNGACYQCHAGTFANALQTACDLCGAFDPDATITSPAGSTSRADCACQPGYVGDEDDDLPWDVTRTTGASCVLVPDGTDGWSPGGRVTVASLVGPYGCPTNAYTRGGWASDSSAGRVSVLEPTGTIDDCLCEAGFRGSFLGTPLLLDECTACTTGYRSVDSTTPVTAAVSVPFGAHTCVACATSEYVDDSQFDGLLPIHTCASCDERDPATSGFGDGYTTGPFSSQTQCACSASSHFYQTITSPNHCIDLSASPCSYADVGETSPCWVYGTNEATCAEVAGSTPVTFACTCPLGYVDVPTPAVAFANPSGFPRTTGGHECREQAVNEYREVSADGVATVGFCGGGMVSGALSDNSALARFEDTPNDCSCASGFYGGGATTHGGCVACTGSNVVSDFIPATLADADPGKTVCGACPNGEVYSDANSACVCKEGYQGSTCTACPLGKYCAGGNRDETEVMCAGGYFCPGGPRVACPSPLVSPAGSSSISACQCPDAASPVPSATPTPGATGLSCGSCDLATDHKELVPASGTDSWPTCQCVAGYTRSGGVCVACAADLFKDAAGDGVCEQCATAGTTSLDGATVCDVPCTVGSYCPGTDNQGITACPLSGLAAGSSLESSDSVADCSCADGYRMTPADECEKCPKGFAGTGGTCGECSSGAYADETGLHVCKTPCPSGKYCPEGSAAAPITCPTNGVCDAATPTTFTCTNGYEKNAAGTACGACPSGTHLGAGAGTCTPCHATSTLGWAAGPFADQGSCACASPFELDGGVCVCPAGQTLNGVGDGCESCDAGTFKTSSGNGACEGCGAGTYSTTIGADEDTCVTCNNGETQDDSGAIVEIAATQCVACLLPEVLGGDISTPTECSICPYLKHATPEGTCVLCPHFEGQPPAPYGTGGPFPGHARATNRGAGVNGQPQLDGLTACPVPDAAYYDCPQNAITTGDLNTLNDDADNCRIKLGCLESGVRQLLCEDVNTDGLNNECQSGLMGVPDTCTCDTGYVATLVENPANGAGQTVPSMISKCTYTGVGGGGGSAPAPLEPTSATLFRDPATSLDQNTPGLVRVGSSSSSAPEAFNIVLPSSPSHSQSIAVCCSHGGVTLTISGSFLSDILDATGPVADSLFAVPVGCSPPAKIVFTIAEMGDRATQPLVPAGVLSVELNGVDVVFDATNPMFDTLQTLSFTNGAQVSGTFQIGDSGTRRRSVSGSDITVNVSELRASANVGDSLSPAK